MRAARLGLALLSALLVRLALPAFDCAPLILVAWVPLIAASASSRPSAALLLGLVQGFALGLAAHSWLVPALLRNFPMPFWSAALALFAVALLVAVRSALVACGVSFLRRAVPVWVSFPVLDVVAEIALPGVFPWTNALAVSSLPVWQQAAAFGGAGAVSAWLCLVNGLLAEAWLRRRSAGSWTASLLRPLLSAGIVLALMTAFGSLLMRLREAESLAAPRARIGLGHYDSSTAVADAASTLRSLSLVEQRASGPPDLWIWPETTVGTPSTRRQLLALENDYLRRDRARASRDVLLGPLLVGAVLDERGTFENSAILFGASGLLEGVYAKHVLMPVGETSELPFGLRLPNLFAQRATPFRSGADSPPLRLLGHSLGLSICYEDILADYVSEQARRSHAALLVNLTSDRWFKGTAAVDFHFALARMRAVEQRRFLVRSTRDGVSAVVDSAGRVVLGLPTESSSVVSISVPLLVSPTWAARGAHALAVLFPLTALGLLAFATLSRRKTDG
ncbi:MAG: apolipoprotein N-acyltransferase [Pseudomonadota bacterium]